MKHKKDDDFMEMKPEMPDFKMEGKGILLVTGHVMVITDNDYRRLQQRLVTGGNVEGSAGLDSGDIIIMQNICMLLQDVSILEK